VADGAVDQGRVQYRGAERETDHGTIGLPANYLGEVNDPVRQGYQGAGQIAAGVIV
jgi:hypothetical protein